jgi:hypothetical protein
MPSHKVLDLIYDALIAHGMNAIRGQQDVTIQSKHLRFEAEVFDKDHQGPDHRLVLEIYVFSALLNTQPVIESFAGFGDTREQALNQAFAKFLGGVFHVVIEGLADHVCDNMQAEVRNLAAKPCQLEVLAKQRQLENLWRTGHLPSYYGAVLTDPGVPGILCPVGKAVHGFRAPRQSFCADLSGRLEWNAN